MEADEDIFDSSRVIEEKKRYHRQLVYGATSLAVTVMTVVGLGLFVAYLATPKDYEAPASKSRLRYFRDWAVFTNVEGCKNTPRKILVEKNGTMADAAVATLLCMGVVHPHSSGLGGGLVAISYRQHTKTARVLMATEVAPKERPKGGSDNPNFATSGWTAAGVPGEVYGYQALINEIGTRMTWGALFTDAIDLATKGFYVDRSLYGALRAKQTQIKSEPLLTKYFMQQRTRDMYEVGDILRNPELGATLRYLASSPPNAFYLGQTSRSLLDDMTKGPKTRRGVLAVEDFSSYTPVWQPAVKVDYGAVYLLTSPAPSAGPALAYIWNIMYELKRKSGGSELPMNITNTHYLLEAFKFAINKHMMLADPTFEDVRKTDQEMQSGEYANRTLSLMRPKALNSTNDYLLGAAGQPSPQEGYGNYFGMRDINGNALLVVSSLTGLFGCMKISESTGIILNNAMHNFSPYEVEVPNNLRARKRPLSPMSPAVFVDPNGHVIFAVVGAGGLRAVTAITQVVIRCLAGEDNLKQAIDYPRLHVQPKTDIIDYEKATANKTIYKLVHAMNHKIEDEGYEPSIGSRLSVVSGFAAVQEGNYTIAVNVDYRDGSAAVDGE
ncbi:scoloptoxin SSD14-like isoform X2 [Ornithodoros turicata]|uniref:scoloptoxin SSD14-like isoform X2 n=1 Tax=Ornithodoros turicata TaxID=34597 RepID=UPI003139C816